MFVRGQAWDVATWGELLLAALQHLHEAHPDRFDAIFTAPEIGRRVQRTAEGMRTPKMIPGGFVELNRSAGSIVGLAASLVSFFGIEAGSVRYAIREG